MIKLSYYRSFSSAKKDLHSWLSHDHAEDLRDEMDSMICKHCEDELSEIICPADHVLLDECLECHMELSHQIFNMEGNVPKCGNLKPMKEEDAQFHPGISDKFVN